ncbi:MAG TPA: prepilin peptidase [Bacillota bacterium]|nr:prepilin peptidase [Bacillota bacterium]HOL09283.1 prepilin peptidase [Bacillota bacterium]HPO96946.1 prepilin peptidase [Bacillota bacterium]
MEYIFTFIIGLVIGSFLNVCIYRIPRNKSIVFPPSGCTKCGHRLQWWELIPVLSFLILRGRCKECREPVSWRYPVVEILTGLLFLISYLLWGMAWETLIAILFISFIIPISFIDLEFQIIPDKISLLGIIVGLLLNYQNIIDRSIGIVVGFGIIFLIILLSRGGMGMGDAKLMAMFGAFWGWKVVLYSLFIGSIFGTVIGLYLIITKKITRKTPIPFGPYLCMGALMAISIQDYIIRWWLIFLN